MGLAILFFIFLGIAFIGNAITAAVSIWALAAKRDKIPFWGQAILCTFIVLAALVMLIGVCGIGMFFFAFIM